MADVKLVNIKKTYQISNEKKNGLFSKIKKDAKAKPADKEFTAVSDINIDIKDKEFVVIVGPSGCGKTTTLRMVAGLEDITEGELYIDGILSNDIEPKNRDIAMVFQNYALYPQMTVYDNIAFPLKLRKVPKEEIDQKVREIAKILDISEFLDRKPKSLSGGQKQRAAIGRALVRNPKVLLMDEPLSNLDAILRNQLRTEIIRLRDKINTTFIYVTHDQIEAMTLGDRIVVMNEGRIQQIGTPQEIFDHPANIFTASFIGTPKMNLLEGRLIKKNEKYVAILKNSGSEVSDGSIRERDGSADNIRGTEFQISEEKQAILKSMENVPEEVVIGVRPVHVVLSDNGIKGVIDFSELMGAELHLHVKSNGNEVVIVLPTMGVDVSALTDRIKEISYSFLTEQMHFFNKETGENIF